jgi:hypothetical protein
MMMKLRQRLLLIRPLQRLLKLHVLLKRKLLALALL